MVQSKKEIVYSITEGQKTAIVKREVTSWLYTKKGIVYTITDYAINGDVTTFISSKEESRSADQVNSFDEYLENNNSYENMNKMQLDFAKAQDWLLVETQTKPPYISVGTDWVKS